MYQEIMDIYLPMTQLSNGIVQAICNSHDYSIVYVKPQQISFESQANFFDYGCRFDIYFQPISPNQTHLTIQGRLNIGFDLFHMVVKKKWRGMLDIIIFSLQLNNNQIIYYGSN